MRDMTDRTSDYLRDYGGRLMELGYPIVPIKAGAKYPQGLPDWRAVKATPAALARWASTDFVGGGVGVRTGHVVGVDLDIWDQELIDELVTWCHAELGTAPRRVGRAPKLLLPYWTDEPFSKITSRTYVDELGLENRIEVLGQGQQFVAYAVHPDTGAPYEWFGGGLSDVAAEDLTPITERQGRALVERFEAIRPRSWTPKPGHRAALPATEGDALSRARPKVDLTFDQVREVLSGFANDDLDYDTWITVGMALHHQFDGDVDGFDLWDEWSVASAKYQANETRKRWGSFAADLTATNPTTFASVLKLAKAAGAEMPRPAPPAGSLLDRFLQRYVHIEIGDSVCDLDKPPHCSISRLREFQNATSKIRHEVEVPAPTVSEPDRTKTKVVPVHQSWLINTHRKSAQGLAFDPKEERFFERWGLWWINEFHMPVFEPADASTDVFWEHIEYLFPMDIEREWFVDWMALNLQRPELRSKVTPLHVARAHGTGRGWLVELMRKLLGPWNCSKTKMDALAGDGSGGAFNDYLHNTLFCAVEEVREGKRRYGISDQIRDVLTENSLEVNRKYGTKSTQTVFTNFFFMSNHPDALVLTERDRRIQVLSGPDEPRDTAYYDRLYAWAEGAGVAALHAELMTRDISRFNWKRSTHTPARDAMIENNQTDTERLFHELLTSPPARAMTHRQVVAAMHALAGGDQMSVDVDERQVTKLLQHYATQGVRLKIDGRAVRPWVFDQALSGDTAGTRNALRKGLAEF